MVAQDWKRRRGADEAGRARMVTRSQATRSGRGTVPRTRSGRRSQRKSRSKSMMDTAPSGNVYSGRSRLANTLHEKSFYNPP